MKKEINNSISILNILREDIRIELENAEVKKERIENPKDRYLRAKIFSNFGVDEFLFIHFYIIIPDRAFLQSLQIIKDVEPAKSSEPV